MLGLSYGHGYTAAQVHAVNAYAIAYWQAGGLVTIDLFARNPWTGGSLWDMNRGNLSELTTPGNSAYTAWQNQLAIMHTGLAELRDAGVIVLWRPFHEMTYQDNFWWTPTTAEWSSQRAQVTAAYVALWRDMFTKFFDLPNLVWVYGAANTDSWQAVDSMWPGNDVVDVTGISLYESTMAGNPISRFAAHGKPFIFTEIGGPRFDGTDDLLTRLAYMKQYPQAKAALFWASWDTSDGKAAIIDERNPSAFMNDAYIITRDEMWR